MEAWSGDFEFNHFITPNSSLSAHQEYELLAERPPRVWAPRWAPTKSMSSSLSAHQEYELRAWFPVQLVPLQEANLLHVGKIIKELIAKHILRRHARTHARSHVHTPIYSLNRVAGFSDLIMLHQTSKESVGVQEIPSGLQMH